MKTVVPDESKLTEVLAQMPIGKPIVMLNLLKFLDQATYPDGFDSAPCSGKEAYFERYGPASLPWVADAGAEVLFAGNVAGILIGPVNEYWDATIIVRYPSIEAFVQMVTAPEYQELSVHRTASLEDSRLIASVER